MSGEEQDEGDRDRPHGLNQNQWNRQVWIGLDWTGLGFWRFGLSRFVWCVIDVICLCDVAGTESFGERRGIQCGFGTFKQTSQGEFCFSSLF